MEDSEIQAREERVRAHNWNVGDTLVVLLRIARAAHPEIATAVEENYEKECLAGWAKLREARAALKEEP